MATNEESADFAIFDPKIGYHGGNVHLSDRKKRVRSVIYDQIPIIWRKFDEIDPVDPEIICLKCLFKNEINASRTYRPRGRHAARAKQWSLRLR